MTSKIYGQEGKAFEPGQMVKISIITIDKKTHDTIPLVLVEIFHKNERILSGHTDIDGKLIIKICSNKLSKDSLTFKTTAIGYKQTTVNQNIRFDSTNVLFMNKGSLKEMTARKKQEYQDSFITECGTDEVNRLYLENAKYRHCDGRILTYQQIQDNHENIFGWERIDKK